MEKKIVYEAHGFWGELSEYDIDAYESKIEDPNELGSNEFFTKEEAEAFVIDEYKGIIQYYQNLIDKLTTNK